MPCRAGLVANGDSPQPAPVAFALGCKPRSSRCYAWRLRAWGCRAGPGRWRPPPAGWARSQRRTPDRTGCRPASGGPGPVPCQNSRRGLTWGS